MVGVEPADERGRGSKREHEPPKPVAVGEVPSDQVQSLRRGKPQAQHHDPELGRVAVREKEWDQDRAQGGKCARALHQGDAAAAGPVQAGGPGHLERLVLGRVQQGARREKQEEAKRQKRLGWQDGNGECSRFGGGDREGKPFGPISAGFEVAESKGECDVRGRGGEEEARRVGVSAQLHKHRLDKAQPGAVQREKDRDERGSLLGPNHGWDGERYECESDQPGDEPAQRCSLASRPH
mmetsp:Transcript_63366/g.142926  ORF Transcript_63366/g.142926 Transcript_63366/m.142926 type:complete len:238 (-) Transcript_63366:1515-2228(-)